MVNFLSIFALLLVGCAVFIAVLFAMDAVEDWAEKNNHAQLYISIKLFWPTLFFAAIALLLSQKVNLYG